MKKGIIIIAFLLIASVDVWAQRDFRKGYIITNQQDTIFGWIDYRGDIRNSRVCSFKKTESDQATEYSPLDIAAYRFIDSKYFVSKNVGSEDAPKLVFLEYLINGLAKIYYYRDENTNEHYYIEKGDQFLELKIDEKEIEVDGKTQIKTIKTYVGVLRAIMNVWEITDEFDKVKLEHASLINIAKNYHQHACTDGSKCIIYEKKKPLIRLRFGPVAGVDLSMLKLMDRDVERYNLDPSTNFAVGMNLNFSAPSFNEKIFLQMQTLYTKYYFFDTFENKQKATDVHVHSNVLQMGLAVKYEYPKGKWRPTFAVGGAAVYMSNGSIEEYIDNFTYQGIRPSIEEKKFTTKFMYGIEVIPGVHYYPAPKRIVFMQLKYMQCYKREHVSHPANRIRSIGLSAGIYF